MLAWGKLVAPVPCLAVGDNGSFGSQSVQVAAGRSLGNAGDLGNMSDGDGPLLDEFHDECGDALRRSSLLRGLLRRFAVCPLGDVRTKDVSLLKNRVCA